MWIAAATGARRRPAPARRDDNFALRAKTQAQLSIAQSSLTLRGARA